VARLARMMLQHSSKKTCPLSNSSIHHSKLMLRITIVKGMGFPNQKAKRRILGRHDIPDGYCQVRYGSSPQVWRTNTINDSIAPEWHESKDVPWIDAHQMIQADVWDANKRGGDDYLGQARFSSLARAARHDGCRNLFAPSAPDGM
jgi:Ca2+-dependent lipid-binding protein